MDLSREGPAVYSITLFALVLVALAVYVSVVPPTQRAPSSPFVTTQLCGTTNPGGTVYIAKDPQFKTLLEPAVQADPFGNWQSSNSYSLGQAVYLSEVVPTYNYRLVTVSGSSPLAATPTCSVYNVGFV